MANNPSVDESILSSIKKCLGIPDDYTPFDTDVTLFINGALMELNQIGVGGNKVFHITGRNETWSDFLGEELENLEAVKSLVYLKVRMIFDPPTIGTVSESFKEQIKKLEWRLNVATDPGTYNDSEESN